MVRNLKCIKDFLKESVLFIYVFGFFVFIEVVVQEFDFNRNEVRFFVFRFFSFVRIDVGGFIVIWMLYDVCCFLRITDFGVFVLYFVLVLLLSQFCDFSLVI